MLRFIQHFLAITFSLGLISPAIAQPPGPGGRGPIGLGGPPHPGQILPPFLQERLNLTADQKKQLDDLQKEVDSKLEKILTVDQKKQMDQMRDVGRGRRDSGDRPGGPGGPGPDGPKSRGPGDGPAGPGPGRPGDKSGGGPPGPPDDRRPGGPPGGPAERPDGSQGRGPGGRPGERGLEGRGGFRAAFQPGQIMPNALQERLRLTPEQKSQVADLQKEVDSKLRTILTEEQRKQIDQMRQGFGRGGRGGRGPGPGGRGPGGDGPGGGPERGPGNPGNPLNPDDGPSRDRLH